MSTATSNPPANPSSPPVTLIDKINGAFSTTVVTYTNPHFALFNVANPGSVTWPVTTPPGITSSVTSNPGGTIVTVSMTGPVTVSNTYQFDVTINFADSSSEEFASYEICIVDFTPENSNPFTVANTFVLSLGTTYTNHQIIVVNAGGDIPTVSMTNVPTGITVSSVLGGSLTRDILINGTPTVLQSATASSLTLTAGSVTGQFIEWAFRVVLPCVSSDSMITMADGSFKAIQYINRGDLVVGYHNQIYRVSRVLSSTHSKTDTGSFCIFKSNSIENLIPYKPLIVTSLHPIIHASSRRHAKFYACLPNVTEIEGNMGDILPTTREGKIKLWDLQFDTVGSFIANGVTLQSRHPKSFLSALPKEDYFNEQLYTSELKDDHDPNYDFPLIYENVIHKTICN